MPELPEVETIRNGLEKLLVNRTILDIKVDNLKSFPNDNETVKEFILSRKVVQVRRRAKILIIELDSQYSLVVHLKMTGQLVFVDSNNRFGAGHPNDSLINKLPDKSTRISLILNNGASLYFNDQRKFGWMKTMPTDILTDQDYFEKYGPEPLHDDFTIKIFEDRLLKHPKLSIKAALLNQTIIAGIGNIYADESLWNAQINPKTVVNKLTNKDIANLFGAIQKVLRFSLSQGGSTDKNYLDAEGKKGSYLKFATVFRKEGQPCPRCGNTIIKTRVASRGTHICPTCQVIK